MKKGIGANYAKINALVIYILQIRLIHLIVTKKMEIMKCIYVFMIMCFT